MSYPTLLECYTRCREIAGDTEGGGQVYTNTILLGHVQAAVREMFRTMRNLAVTRVIREVYYILPMNTTVLLPASVGINDFAEPIQIAERGGLTSFAVSGAVNVPTGLQVTTTAPHGFNTGYMVTLNALGGLRDVDGAYGVTVTSPTQFIANGLYTVGAYTIGGTAAHSSNNFARLDMGTTVKVSQDNNTRLTNVAWRENRLWFPLCNEDRQLQIIYYSSGTVPVASNDQVTVDDSLDFLATYAMCLASGALGADTMSGSLRKQSVGERWDEGIPGGQLRNLMQAAVRELQNRPVEERCRQAYRPIIPVYGF